MDVGVRRTLGLNLKVTHGLQELGKLFSFSESHFYVKEDGNCKPAGFLFALKEIMNTIWSQLAHRHSYEDSFLFPFHGLVLS